jgi:hypothetical protein
LNWNEGGCFIFLLTCHAALFYRLFIRLQEFSTIVSCRQSGIMTQKEMRFVKRLHTVVRRQRMKSACLKSTAQD